jgi:integrase
MPYVIHYHGKPVKSIKKVWRTARIAAGLDKTVTPHSLRRTRATWLMKEGIDTWEAAQHLGMSIEILVRHYAQYSPNFQKRAAEI